MKTHTYKTHRGEKKGGEEEMHTDAHTKKRQR